MVTTGNYPNGGFFTYEAVAWNPGSTTVSQTPVATCKYPTTWPTASLHADRQLLHRNGPRDSADVLAGVMAQPVRVHRGLRRPGGATFTEGYVCYTPLGRSYVTISPTVAGARLAGHCRASPVFTGLSSVSAIEIRVTRTDGATIRSVLVPNNGMARVFSHTQ